jgi:hypothetical protein
MNTETQDLASIQDRLEKLESQNRWIKRAGAGALVLAALLVLMAAQEQPAAKNKEPEKLVLRDGKGNERVWLGMSSEGPILRFRDDEGKERIWLGLQKNTPGLVVYDEQGKRQATLSTSKSGVNLVFYDEGERRRGWLILGKDGPALHLLGKQHAAVSVEEDGVAIWHHDKAGKILTGVNSLKQLPGARPQGELVDPLFPKPE